MRRLLVAIAAVTAMLALAGSAAAQKVGVVDIVRLFNEFKKAKDLFAGLDKEREQMETEANQMQQKINALVVASKELDKSSAEYLRMRQEALKLGFDLKSHKEYSTQKLFMQHRLMTERLYNELLGEIGVYARKHGFALILSLDEIKIEDSKSIPELQARIAVRKVLFHDKTLDLTEAILKQVDSKDTSG